MMESVPRAEAKAPLSYLIREENSKRREVLRGSRKEQERGGSRMRQVSGKHRAQRYSILFYRMVE